MTSMTVHQPRPIDSTERAIKDETRRRSPEIALTAGAFLSVVAYGLTVGFIAVMAAAAR